MGELKESERVSETYRLWDFRNQLNPFRLRDRGLLLAECVDPQIVAFENHDMVDYPTGVKFSFPIGCKDYSSQLPRVTPEALL